MHIFTNSIRLSALVAGALVACSTGSQQSSSQPAPADQPRLEVVNRSVNDMDVYIIRSGQRIRLGLAPNGQTTRFSLSPGLTIGAGTVVFEAVPLVGGQAVSTDPTALPPKATVTLDIPPP
jgi:hypothetical protein